MQKTSKSKWKYPDFIPEICIMESPMQIQKGMPNNSTDVTTWKKRNCMYLHSVLFLHMFSTSGQVQERSWRKRALWRDMPCKVHIVLVDTAFVSFVMLPKRASASDFPPTTDYKETNKTRMSYTAPKGAFPFPQAITPIPTSHPHYQFNSSSLCFSYYQIKKNILQMLLHTAQNSLPWTWMLVNGFIRYQITWLWFSA